MNCGQGCASARCGRTGDMDEYLLTGSWFGGTRREDYKSKAMHTNPSLSGARSLRSETAFYDYARNVGEAQTDFLQTDHGRTSWSVGQRRLGTTVLQFAAVGAGTIAAGLMRQPDKLIFLMQSSPAQHCIYLNGTMLPAHAITVLAPGADFIFANLLPLEWLSFSVGLDRLPPRLIDRLSEPIAPRTAALLVSQEACFAELIDVAARAARLHSTMGSRRSVLEPVDGEGELIDALTAAVEASEPDRSARKQGDRSNYETIVHLALAGIHDEGIVPVADLCQAIGIAERTLQRAFNRIFRMSPRRYLKLLQLNQVHAAFCAAESRGQLVTDILTRHGVTELGRFASEYRALFGELPSQTIRSGRYFS